MKHEKLERQLLENPDFEARVKTSGEGLEEEGGGGGSFPLSLHW